MHYFLFVEVFLKGKFVEVTLLGQKAIVTVIQGYTIFPPHTLTV
jgi:hypothetical protein